MNFLLSDKYSRIAKNYFSMTWDGPSGSGLSNGKNNLPNLFRTIDETFEKNYLFMKESGEIINQGTETLKSIMEKLTTPLFNLKMTSFDILSVNDLQNFVKFQSTSIADVEENGAEKYGQFLRLSYFFNDDKVSKVIVHHHTNYDF